MQARVNQRLLRDFREITEEGPKNNIHASLVNEDLFRWRVLMTVDSTTKFGKILQKNNCAGITLELVFNDDYPRSAPFVRVLSPQMYGGHVMSSGALCMQSVSQSGWSLAFTAMNLIISIRETILRDGDVQYYGPRFDSTEMDARMVYTSIMVAHGWGAFVPTTARNSKAKGADKKETNEGEKNAAKVDDSKDNDEEVMKNGTVSKKKRPGHDQNDARDGYAKKKKEK